MWGALSDERTGLSFARVQSAVVSLLSVCKIYILHVIKCVNICIHLCIKNIYKAFVSPGSVEQIMPYF
jgi:hypothetical protein